jgi:hypothetical protein
VLEVKQATQGLIKTAWDQEIRPIPGNALPDEAQPDIASFTENFLKDVRSQLSPWFWRKLAVRGRNQRPN